MYFTIHKIGYVYWIFPLLPDIFSLTGILSLNFLFPDLTA